MVIYCRLRQGSGAFTAGSRGRGVSLGRSGQGRDGRRSADEFGVTEASGGGTLQLRRPVEPKPISIEGPADFDQAFEIDRLDQKGIGSELIGGVQVANVVG